MAYDFCDIPILMSWKNSIFQPVLSHSNYPEKKKEDKLGTARRVIYVRRDLLVSPPSY